MALVAAVALVCLGLLTLAGLVLAGCFLHLAGDVSRLREQHRDLIEHLRRRL